MAIRGKGEKRGKSRRQTAGSRSETRSRRVRARNVNADVDPPLESATPTTAILEGVKHVGPTRRGNRHIKPKGLPLGIKFALVISLVSAGLCFFAELFVYVKVKQALLQEIDRKGIALVKSIGNSAEEFFY